VARARSDAYCIPLKAVEATHQSTYARTLTAASAGRRSILLPASSVAARICSALC
jgi:hypothetical protein